MRKMVEDGLSLDFLQNHKRLIKFADFGMILGRFWGIFVEDPIALTVVGDSVGAGGRS